MQLHVTLVQWAAAPGDPAANRAAGTTACRAAAAAGADVVLFPEMWQTGYAACPFDPTGQAAWEAQAIALDAPFITHFQALARALDLAIVLTFLERHAPLPRDSAVLIDRQGASPSTTPRSTSATSASTSSPSRPRTTTPSAATTTARPAAPSPSPR